MEETLGLLIAIFIRVSSDLSASTISPNDPIFSHCCCTNSIQQCLQGIVLVTPGMWVDISAQMIVAGEARFWHVFVALAANFLLPMLFSTHLFIALRLLIYYESRYIHCFPRW
jgi:hypothetical protein